MKLNQYPDAIAQSKRQLLTADRMAKQAKFKWEEIIAEMDTAIAFDAELKNDAQRKARRNEALKSDACVDAFEFYRVAAERLEDLEIDHTLLLHRFSVAKLEAQDTISKTEFQAAAAA
ncbi:MAG: hypothetical protein HC781_15090 [Leptolyngbyaceae cyanobacterium CSU_1_4]|nr:hypothetical protein [Leptolyngbyaceae cyanobacterium CSU_1_4]